MLNKISYLLAGGMLDFMKRPLSLVMHFFGELWNLVFVLVYWLFWGVAFVVNFVEIAFKKIAGLDTIYLNGSAYNGAKDGSGKDLVYAFITDATVMNVFWSIVALSIVLLFVFTIIAMIKSEFTLDLKGSAKGPIISRALKSFVNMLVVPTIAIISIFGTNILTKTIYDLFDANGDTIVSKCFLLGGMSSNRARTDEKFSKYISNGSNWISGGSSPFVGKTGESLAKAIDNAFAKATDCRVTFKVYDNDERLDREEDEEYADWNALFMKYPENGSKYSMFDVKQVNYFYDLTQFNFVLAIGSAVAIGLVLLSVTLVLLKRIFELTILFLLAPPMIAIAPLDGGQAEKKWRQEFLKRLLAIIGPIFAINMFFLLIPLFEGISLFGGKSGNIFGFASIGASTASSVSTMTGGIIAAVTVIPLYDMLFQVICIYTGLSILKSASAILSNLLGVEDLVKSGAEAAKSAQGNFYKATKVAGAVGGLAVKGAATALKAGAAPFSALGNTLKTQRSRGEAKGQLDAAEDKAAEAGDNVSKAESDYNDAVANVRNSDDYKAAQDRLKKLEEADDGTSHSKAEIAKAREGLEQMVTDGTANQKTALDEARAAKEKADMSVQHRKAGISERREAAMEAKAAKEEAKYRSENTNEYKTDAKYFDSKTGLYKRDEYRKLAEERDKEIEAGAKEARLNRIATDSGKFGTAVANRNVLKNIASAYETEWGENSDKTSFLAQATTKAVNFTTGANPIGLDLSKIPLLKKVPDLLNSVKEYGAVSGSSAVRRMNDAISGAMGEVGGDIWKTWFNKNARAKMWESVPEDKARGAGIDNGLLMEARNKFTKGEEEKAARKAAEKEIRRMLAQNMGGGLGMAIAQQYKLLESGNLNAAQIKKVEAKIEELELKGGYNSINKNATKFYDEVTPGSDKAKQLQAFKDQMQMDAAQKAYAAEKANKERAIAAAAAAGDKPEVKISDMSGKDIAHLIAEQLEKALSSTGKGINIKGVDKGARINVNLGQAMNEAITSQVSVLQELSKALAEAFGDAKGNLPKK